MWSRRALILGALAVAACGFQPAYAPGGPGTRLQGQVRAADPRTSDDYAFLRQIEDRLGAPAAPRYDLAYTLRIASVGQAITSDDVTTRYSLNGTAAYTLTDAATGAVTRINHSGAKGSGCLVSIPAVNNSESPGRNGNNSPDSMKTTTRRPGRMAEPKGPEPDR